MKKEVLKEFFKKYVKDTPYKAIVADRKVFLCYFTKAVLRGIGVNSKSGGIYATSRFLKHLFDKKPAEEFFFLIDNLHKVVKYPDKIYKNKDEKRGEYCFVKRVGDFEYLCSLEIVKLPPAILDSSLLEVSEFGKSEEMEEIQIATAFRLRDEDYIKKYTLLWSWGGGDPHRSAFDTPRGSTNAPQ